MIGGGRASGSLFAVVEENEKRVGVQLGEGKRHGGVVGVVGESEEENELEYRGDG